MVASSAIVKDTAKTALKPNYLKSVIGSTVVVFSSIICYLLSKLLGTVFGRVAYYTVLALFILFILIPLFYGLIRFFRRMQWGQNDGVISIFYYFSSKHSYLRVIKLNVIIALRLLVIGLVLMIPAVITDVLQNGHLYDLFGITMPLWTSNLWIVSEVLKVSALIVLFFVSLRFYIAPFLFVADDGIDVLEALHFSTVISKRTAFDFFFLIISFALWILLSILLMPLCFILPYFIMSYLVHCRFAVAQYNRVVDEISGNNSAPYYSADI